MNIRRKLALFLDPSLAGERTPPIRLGMDELTALRTIARSLESIEKRRRRPRNVLCQHPELHSEIAVPFADVTTDETYKTRLQS